MKTRRTMSIGRYLMYIRWCSTQKYTNCICSFVRFSSNITNYEGHFILPSDNVQLYKISFDLRESLPPPYHQQQPYTINNTDNKNINNRHHRFFMRLLKPGQALYNRSLAHCTLLFALFLPQDVAPHACIDHNPCTEVDDLG